ncbi:hypothetical protein D3C86_2037170 [compost metagenome]
MPAGSVSELVMMVTEMISSISAGLVVRSVAMSVPPMSVVSSTAVIRTSTGLRARVCITVKPTLFTS